MLIKDKKYEFFYEVESFEYCKGQAFGHTCALGTHNDKVSLLGGGGGSEHSR